VETRVAVIGGGIGGLATGVALQRHGMASTVYEQAPVLHEIGAGVALWPSALSVMDRVGLGSAVRALGRPWAIAALRRHDGSFLVRYTSEDLAASLGEPTIAVHRGELQSLLLSALPPGAVHTGRRCERIERCRDGTVALHFTDGGVVHADAVIGADGLRSMTRVHLFGDGAARVRDCRYASWRGTATQPSGTDWHTTVGETWGPAGRFGFVPISRSRIAWYAAVRDLGTGDRAALLECFGDWHDPIPALIDRTVDEHLWRDRIYDRWPLRRWSVGPVTLLGDAAHPMTPELGQGACQAVLDAWTVADALARSPDPTTAFRTYERTRRPRAWFVTLVAELVAAAGRRDDAISDGLRSGMLRLVPDSLIVRQLRLVCGRAP
jgi:2-polyprenyl-6-methoxyphenol hydroxylase-like FAD-dependent oxidoreductase